MQVLPSRMSTDASATGHYMRLLAWGAGAALAMTLAIAASRTELGSERAQLALSDVLGTRPVAKDSSSQIVAWSSAVDAQIRRQAEVIRDLKEQREGLTDKVGSIERQVNELGGTLSRALMRLDADAKTAREAAIAASNSAAAAAANTRPAEPRQATESTVAAPGPPGMPPGSASQREGGTPTLQTRPATVAASHPPRELSAPLNLLPYNQIPGQIPGLAPGDSGFAAASATSAPAYTGAVPMPTPEPAATQTAVQAPAAHPTPPIPVPLPLPVTAARMASAELPAAASLPHGTKPHLTTALPQLQSNPLMTAGIFNGPIEPGAVGQEFAVDLGGAPTVETLRTRWNELRASQSPLLDSLTPLVALKEGSQTGQELHLIAGPLASTTATARLCAVLTSGAVTCRPSVFEGQRLMR